VILRPGHWLGRGSVLIEGMSLGRTLECDARVEADETGFLLNAEVAFQEGEDRNVNLRIAGNEVGTYTLRLSTAGEVFHGTAKLDSPPNLGLMWNESETVHLTFTLFTVSQGIGCRGFLRDGETTYTWEVAFSLKQDVVKGDNVISLDRRRR
jgi:hypothetical protein